MNTSDLRQRPAARYTDTGDVALVYLFGSQTIGAGGPASNYDSEVPVARDYDERQVTASFSHLDELVERLTRLRTLQNEPPSAFAAGPCRRTLWCFAAAVKVWIRARLSV